MDEDFLDETMGFMIKAVIVSGCVLALFPTVIFLGHAVQLKIRHAILSGSPEDRS